MKPQEFVCWLDGAFSLNEGKDLNASQTALIKNKLSQVDKNAQDKHAKVCNWLQGYFDMVEPVTLDAHIIGKIQEKILVSEKKNLVNDSKNSHPSPFEPSIFDQPVRC